MTLQQKYDKVLDRLKVWNAKKALALENEVWRSLPIGCTIDTTHLSVSSHGKCRICSERVKYDLDQIVTRKKKSHAFEDFAYEHEIILDSRNELCDECRAKWMIQFTSIKKGEDTRRTEYRTDHVYKNSILKKYEPIIDSILIKNRIKNYTNSL